MAYYNDEQLAKKLQQELADEELAKKLQDEWNLQPQPNVVLPGIVPPGIIHPPRPVNTVLDRVCGMVYDNEATRLAGKYGLNVQNVSWEDNARSKGSSWGPCISDMTLQVDGHMLPVIRSPNFEDLTWDIPMEKIPLVVGNEKGGNLHTVTLKQYLENFRNYLHKPNGWKGHRSSLFAARDTHVVTSAQACFLPINASEETKFNVAIYNYQTRHDDPAILAIVASSKGTSAQVLTGSDSKLYFNNNGEKCPFVGQRLTDFRREKGEPTQGPMTQQEKQQNMLLIIQVPLKQKLPPPQMNYLAECYDDECEVMPQACLSSFAAPSAPGAKLRSNVEDAIIKVGKSEGSFEEIQNFDIERDERYPVRVTMQFYKATDNGVVNDDNIKQISEQIQGARKNADFIGSLVVGGVSNRPTEPTLPNRNPYVTPAWWTEFWLVYRNVFPQYTEERAKDKVFSGGRFANSTMNEAKDQLIDILSAESDPNKKPQPVWNVL